MLCVETIGKIRRAHFRDGRSIKGISRDFRLSRETVRKVLRSGATEFVYARRTQPRPKIGPWESRLEGMLDENASRSGRERVPLTRIFEELQGLGLRGRLRRRAAIAPAGKQPLQDKAGQDQFDIAAPLLALIKQPGPDRMRPCSRFFQPTAVIASR